MSLLTGNIIIYTECKSRWFEKYRYQLLYEFAKYKYCRPSFHVNLLLKHSAYPRTRLFKDRSEEVKFKFVVDK